MGNERIHSEPQAVSEYTADGHCQMTLWAESVYKSGFKDGKEAALQAREQT